jgi:hypothetical protein
MPKHPKFLNLVIAAVYTSILIASLMPAKAFGYTTLQNRSITISSSVGGAVNNHTFSFTFPTTVNVGSIFFEYCTDPIDGIVCDQPPGMDAIGAVLDSQSGETGFYLREAASNHILLSRTAANVGPQDNVYSFSNITNPSDVGPFYVRISAYSSEDGSGSFVSFSSVAASIDTGININAEVPPILYFCSAISIPTDCSDAVGDFIEFGTLSASITSAGTSQFMVGTNAPNGYSVTTNGPTMTSGTNQIAGVIPPTISKIGNSQFGINLRANLSPLVGAEPNGGSGTVAADYSTPNKFNFVNGDIVAQSTGPTELSLFTVSYIVNIHPTQASGIYNTTLTYVCTAGF